MQKNKENLRIAFMGTPDFSVTILESLLENGYQIAIAFSQDDKIVGRKKIVEKTPVKIFCEKHNIPVFTPKKIDASAKQVLLDNAINLVILVAYGKILPQDFLQTPPLGAINIHPSLLPKFRGPSPVQNALLQGEETTGSTIMLMDSGIDTGDILAQKEFAIQENEVYPLLKQRLAVFSAQLLVDTLEDYLQNKLIPQKQDSSCASYCKLIKREDGKIDWNDSGIVIMNKFRAFFGWPGTYALWEFDGTIKRIKLNKISYLDTIVNAHYQIGEVFLHGNLPCVQTGLGAILIHQLQIEGKSNMPASNFINGYKNFIGSLLK